VKLKRKTSLLFRKLHTKILKILQVKSLLTIITIVGGYLTLFISNNLLDNKHMTTCLFKGITGIPCAGCGMGRATIALFSGNIYQSLSFNLLCIPLTIAIILSVCWLLSDILNQRETFFNFIKHEINRKYKLIIFGILILNWTINIVRL
jgi:hypothetical protein